MSEYKTCTIHYRINDNDNVQIVINTEEYNKFMEFLYDNHMSSSDVFEVENLIKHMDKE